MCFTSTGFTQLQQQYLFTHIGTRRGLAADETSEVQQDDRGFIWVGTSNGLQRYDGRRFLSFRHTAGDPSSIPDDEVLAVKLHNNNRLWLLCGENQVGYFNVIDNRFHEAVVKLPADVLKKYKGKLIIEANGNILLLLDGYGVVTYNEKQNEFSAANNRFQLPQNWKPSALFADSDANCWIGCDSGLVKFNSKLNRLSYRGHLEEQDAVIKALEKYRNISLSYQDKAGRYWFVVWPAGSIMPQLYSYDINTRQLNNWSARINSMLKGSRYDILGIKEQRDGTLWIMGNNLFARFNSSNSTFELIQNNLPGEFSIRYDMVQSVYEDRENSLWACTNSGMYRFNPAAQVFYTFNNKRVDDRVAYNSDVSDIIQTRTGEIMIATLGDDLFAYNNDLEPLVSDAVSKFRQLHKRNLLCIHQSVSNDIWVADADGGLSIYSNTGRRAETFIQPLFEGSNVVQIAEDKQGNLWLGSSRGHLVKWDISKKQFALVRKFNANIQRLYIDRMNDLWVGTSASGLYRMNTADNSVKANYTSQGKEGKTLLGIGANDIIQYNDSIYIIASGGLNVLNIHSNSFTYFSKENGMLTNSVENIVKDRKGYVWITSKLGLCSINIEKQIVTFYDERDGIHTNAFLAGSACLLNDGRIAVGTTHDVLIFDPVLASQNTSQQPPNVTISGFAVMNKWQPMDSINKLPFIELKPDQNSVTIEVSTLSYQTIYGFFYMLEGLDKDWNLSPQQNQITYNYLPPGTYTFKVICKNGDGVSSKQVAELKIKVKPVFWKTWWFFSLVLTALVVLVYWFDKERMKRKEGLQKIRSDIADNLHNEVNTALNNINILSEMARIKADTEPQKSKEYIEQIHTKSHNMIIAMDDMLWSLSPQNDNMQKTVERMREYIDSLKNRHAVQIDIAVEKKVEQQELNMKLRHEAFLLFKEGIKSLVKAGTRKCSIHIDTGKNVLQFVMQFENAGCDMQQLNNLLHRQDLEANMKSINASFNVQVHKTNSVFTLLIPVGNESIL